MTDDLLARVGLSCVIEPGSTAVCEAVAQWGAGQVWQALRTDESSGTLARKARLVEPEVVLQRAHSHQIRFVVPGDTQWPDQVVGLDCCEPVQGMSGAPLGLWIRGAGDLGALESGSVAIVGSRSCSPYGGSVAADLGHDLADSGHVVVSGGAFGIDAAAHRGALASRGMTMAVLAGGLDQAYPKANHQLFAAIAERGLLISEFPPGEHPTRMRFLGRNRLIAGLTQGTVIVEAAARSGARNTANWANRLSRVVMAVPGAVTSTTSYTPHQLIRQAEAVLVSNSDEIAELLGALGRPATPPAVPPRLTDSLDADGLRVFDVLPFRAGLEVAEVALAAGLALPTTLAVLDQLAEAGLAEQDQQWLWRVTADARRTLRREAAARNPVRHAPID